MPEHRRLVHETPQGSYDTHRLSGCVLAQTFNLWHSRVVVCGIAWKLKLSNTTLRCYLDGWPPKLRTRDTCLPMGINPQHDAGKFGNLLLVRYWAAHCWKKWHMCSVWDVCRNRPEMDNEIQSETLVLLSQIKYLSQKIFIGNNVCLKDQPEILWLRPIKYLSERSFDSTLARANQAFIWKISWQYFDFGN